MSAEARLRDEMWMRRALDLAATQLGRVAPNPAVGCLIVVGEHLIAQGVTGDGGRPHAEELALEAAGGRAKGATAYVTLEPCSARSNGSPSCARRLVDAGVARVVIACLEPNPASHEGQHILCAAGIETDLGVLEAEARRLNCGFFKRLSTGRPWVAIDANAAAYDAGFAMLDGESADEALNRLGRAGLTRVHATPGSADARLLADAGLIDESRT